MQLAYHFCEIVLAHGGVCVSMYIYERGTEIQDLIPTFLHLTSLDPVYLKVQNLRSLLLSKGFKIYL